MERNRLMQMYEYCWTNHSSEGNVPNGRDHYAKYLKAHYRARSLLKGNIKRHKPRAPWDLRGRAGQRRAEWRPPTAITGSRSAGGWLTQVRCLSRQRVDPNLQPHPSVLPPGDVPRLLCFMLPSSSGMFSMSLSTGSARNTLQHTSGLASLRRGPLWAGDEVGYGPSYLLIIPRTYQVPVLHRSYTVPCVEKFKISINTIRRVMPNPTGEPNQCETE